MIASRDLTDFRSAIVSILLPARNAERTLAACLRSIQRQSEPRWTCVIVDDGSTDGTRGVARRFAESDPRFRFFAQSQRGLVATLNAGLRLCVGDYVARMDADDLMHRERLQEQVTLLESRFDLAAVGCHVRVFPRRSLTEGARAYERWLNSIDSPEAVRREAFIECPIAHPTLMIRRKCLAARGYREQGWPEDYDLLLRLLRDGRQIGVLPRRLLGWRDHPQRLSRTAATYGLDRFTACKAAFLAQTLLAGGEVYDLWGYGETGRTLRRALERHGKRPRYIVEVHPGRLGNRIHGAEVIPPERLGHPSGPPLLVSVAGLGPRTEIRRTLETMGYRETEHFICTA